MRSKVSAAVLALGDWMGSWQQEGQKAEAAGRGRRGVGVCRHIPPREKGHGKKAS